MTPADPDTDYLQRARDFAPELAAAAPEIERQGGAEFLLAQGRYSCAVVDVDLCRGHDRARLRTNGDRRGPAGQARQTLRNV
jgi:hypothetical protein